MPPRRYDVDPAYLSSLTGTGLHVYIVLERDTEASRLHPASPELSHNAVV